MFLEEMQIYYRVEASPAEVAATATKGAAERVSCIINIILIYWSVIITNALCSFTFLVVDG